MSNLHDALWASSMLQWARGTICVGVLRRRSTSVRRHGRRHLIDTPGGMVCHGQLRTSGISAMSLAVLVSDKPTTAWMSRGGCLPGKNCPRLGDCHVVHNTRQPPHKWRVRVGPTPGPTRRDAASRI